MFHMYQSTPVAGDCTCGYRIELDKEYTVGEFINAVLSEKNKEWGSIGIYDGRSIFGSPGCQYEYGTLTTDNLPEDTLNATINSVSASGGWSRMDYLIHMESGYIVGYIFDKERAYDTFQEKTRKIHEED